MNMICVIPARIGSKRLEKKNIKLLNGLPMIYYSIKCAQDTKLFDKIYVATDDQDIADISKKYGAIVPFLIPKELCVDDQPSHIPCQYLIKKLNVSCDTLLCLQPTSPTRTSSDIINSIKLFKENNYDFLISSTMIDPHYFHWAVTKEDNSDNYQMYFGNKYMKERIYLPDIYRPNGSIKIAKLEKLVEIGNFFGKNLGVIETSEENSIHVKDLFEFKHAENIIRER